MNHVSSVNLKEGQSPHHFTLPPIHLFWGASEQNQRTYYHHLLILWNVSLLQGTVAQSEQSQVCAWDLVSKSKTQSYLILSR